MHECLSRWHGLRRITDREICEAVAGLLTTARSATEGDYYGRIETSEAERMMAIAIAEAREVTP